MRYALVALRVPLLHGTKMSASGDGREPLSWIEESYTYSATL